MVGDHRVARGVLVAAMYVLLLAPIAVVVPLSFSGESYLAFPPRSWSTQWYAAMLAHDGLARTLRVSLGLASLVTTIALGCGVPAAYALARGSFPGRQALATLFMAPLLVPSVILGLALLLTFSSWGVVGSFAGLVLAHVVVCSPYVVRIMTTALASLPTGVEEAAATLGASPAVVFRRVTVPLVRPAVVASAVLSFLISFDEVVVSVFITGPRLSTLPVEIFSYVDTRTDPLIAAVSVALVTVTLAGVAIIERTLGLARAVAGSTPRSAGHGGTR